MTPRIFLMTCAVGLGSLLNSDAASPDQFLPPDTLAVFAIPDCTGAAAAWRDQAIARLWRDPAMRPFRDKLEGRLRESVIAPWEERLGMSLTNQLQLLRGSLTIAWVGNGWPGKQEAEPDWLVALDSRDRAAELATQINQWKTNLAAAGHQIRSERAGEREYSVISPRRDANEVWIGQTGSMLWVGSSKLVLEQARARGSGNGGVTLMANPEFERAHKSALGSAQLYGWVHLKPLLEFLGRQGAADEASGALGLLQPSTLLPALGLQDVRSLSFAANSTPAGTSGELRIGVPESSRTGLFRMLLPGRNPADPPAFVTEATTRFQRLRVDLPGAWAALEDAVYSVLPTARSVVDLMLQSVGKDQDPNYDLRRELFGNLGNDVIVMEHQPTTNGVEDASAARTLVLIGSRSPRKVADAMKQLTSLLPPPMNALRQREALGTTIYSMALPQEPGTTGGAPTKWFSFAAGTNYLAMSGDTRLLERFLSGTEPGAKPLSGIEGLAEAAEAVGGMESGWFGYEADRAVAESIIESWRQDPGTVERLLSLTPAGDAIGTSGGLKAWADFTLLPPFEQIARYFHFTVYGLDLGPDDFAYRFFSPVPPGPNP
jgi:hypothetical protein